MTTTGKRVLLVEDDRFLRRACEASLRSRGLTVLTAVDGEEGLQMARAERPDLVLLDFIMPRMTGLEVLRALKADESTRSIRVVMLTNASRPQDMDEVTKLGAAGYFIKANLSLQALGEEVTKLLEG
jgi:CheY-like chemotaxis protein